MPVKWNWQAFMGSELCLKWARRDLGTLEAALTHVPGRTACVQAGGNLGIFPKYLAGCFKTVYTFEPDVSLFAALMVNAPEQNIVKIQAALGFERGPVRMECSRRDGTPREVHEGLTHVAGRGTIPCLQIDDLGLGVCDLIYLDVEGWEFKALLGANNTIKRCRPVIGVEINRNITFAGDSAEALRALIASYDYECKLTSHSDEIYVPR